MKAGQKYDHRAVEAKWNRAWLQSGINIANTSAARRPFYNLMMFPYPSAEGLHVGNMYAFTGSDIFGRFKRMQGNDVFEPIGLDGFGIHSENYALKIGRHPMDHARITEEHYYNQLHSIGAMFDWTRTVETYDPDYYKWTQWLFIQMFKHGLAYRGEAEVNWCPSDKTVLADEQVIDGRCERCGNLVEKRELKQWFFRITAFAEKLLENTFTLEWSEKVKLTQRNWIGKKEGNNIEYPVEDSKGKRLGSIICFTTRPDTNFGATFVVIAPEHSFITQLTEVIKSDRVDVVSRYVKEAKKKTKEDRISERRKKTAVFTGCYCINRLNGYKMPLYVSDFVLGNFGTGAVVGVPGHDLRDFEFAKEFKLPIIRVVTGKEGETGPIEKKEQVQEEEGKLINSEFLNGLDVGEAIKKINAYLVEKAWGKPVTTYHLRDWLISRQRYWGAPIPMIYCEACAKAGKSWFTQFSVIPKKVEIHHGEQNRKITDRVGDDRDQSLAAGWYPVPDDKLPVVLPRIEDYKPGDDGVAPLAKHKEFYETTCPGCGGKSVRETDVSDTFLDSSWYFLKYPSVGSGEDRQALPWDPTITKKWLPVDMYTGGAEHSVLHLMYSRFVTMALHDWGYLGFEEPFKRFFAHGLVIKDGAKMSKSKGNVVNPDEYIVHYGADALRLYLMFMGPFSEGGDFRDTAMEGMSRWVGRIWRMVTESIVQTNQLKQPDQSEIARTLNKLINKVTDDLEKRRYNTAIASMMEFTNVVADKGGLLDQHNLKIFILLLAPFAPFLAEELWERHETMIKGGQKDGKSSSVHLQSWPSYSPEDNTAEKVTVIIQINGKLRDTVMLNRVEAQNQNTVEAAVRSREKVKKQLTGREVRKTIFIPGKLINFVTG